MAKNTPAPNTTPNASSKKVVKKALRKSLVCTVSTIEDQIFKLEGIRVIIRLPEYVGGAASDGLGYDWTRMLNRDETVGHLSDRIERVFAHPVSFVCVRGDGTIVEIRAGKGQRSTLLSSLRESYKKTARATKARVKVKFT